MKTPVHLVIAAVLFVGVLQAQEAVPGNTLAATGYYRVENVNDRWFFISPKGERYIALGANHVGKYLNLQADELGLLARFDGDQDKAAEFLIDQMKRMGLTAGEAYAPIDPRVAEALPWVANIHFPFKSKFEFDVFDPDTEQRLSDSIIDQTSAIRDNPMVLGLAFADLPVWNEKRVAFYEKLNKDAPGSKQLAEFRRQGKTDHEFLGHVAIALYRVLAAACDRGAPNHLFFGERFQLRDAPDEVLVAVGKHVDVFCTQALIRSPQRPPEWQRFQADRYDYEHKLTGKPMIIIDWAAPFSLAETYETDRGTLYAEREAAEQARTWLIDAMKRHYMIGVFKCQLIGLHGNDHWFEGKARRTFLQDNGTEFNIRTDVTREVHAAALRQAFQN
jgi:hypothetical protein